MSFSIHIIMRFQYTVIKQVRQYPVYRNFPILFIGLRHDFAYRSGYDDWKV